MTCPLCGGPRETLPVPGPFSVVSDGRRLDRPLAKASCMDCGAASHVAPPGADAVRALYSDDYSLGSRPDPGLFARGAGYARAILDLVAGRPAPRRVLDVGCGSGATLAGLRERLPDAAFAGVEAAEQAAAAARAAGFDVAHGFVEALAPGAPFDLVCAVNVIEHTVDPSAFFASLAARAAAEGIVVIVCPQTAPPNLELLFFDHLWSLTPRALARAGAAAGLRLERAVGLSAPFEEFQAAVFSKGPGPSDAPPQEPLALHASRVKWLDRWAALDASLAARLPKGVACFGAGEAAAILRAYAPSAWARVDALVLDDPATAWALGPPARPYAPARGLEKILLGVHPGRQTAVAERLAADGYAPVEWFAEGASC